MLEWILGLSGTGKTTELLARMRARSEAGKTSVLLVPEQFSSSAETMVYTALGDALSSRVSVQSFTSLAENLLKTFGGTAAKTLTDAGRVVLVRRAAEEVQDELTVYRRHRRSVSFCSLCADAIQELKTAGAPPQALLEAAGKQGEAGEKLRELALVYAAYEARLGRTALDPSDRVAAAAKRLSEHPQHFAHTHVYIDNFDGFTAPQYAMLAQLVRAEGCTVALCCDGFADHDGGMGLFSPVKHVAQRLRRIAAAQGVRVAAPTVLEEERRHAHAPGIAAAGRVVAVGETEQTDAAGFWFTRPKDVREECFLAACTAVKLARQGVPFGKMAVVCRSLDGYGAPLREALTLAGVPFFIDESTTLEYSAPASFFRAALALAARGVTSEGILRLLKTDLCGFSAGEIAAAENYAYVWQLKGSEWREPFAKSAAGFAGRETAQDAETLETAERVRAAVMPKLDRFLQRVKGGGTAEDISRALYRLLEDFGGAAHTLEQAAHARETGDEARSVELCSSYNTAMGLLDELNALCGADDLTAAEYDELLLLLVRASEVGRVPQTQNNLIVTTADRMRLASPVCCFVLGAAEGEFPKSVGFSGLLTHADRETLVSVGIEMPGSYENRTLLEQMAFYRAITAPSERLYVSCPDTKETAGALVPALAALEPPEATLTDDERAPTAAAALDLLGECYREDTPRTAALEEALRRAGQADAALDAMAQAASPRPFAVRDTRAVERLLGRSMVVSPTRVEQYYRCRFSYFLQYVLRIRPRRKAELSPLESGTLVHFILENALRRTGETFTQLTPDELRTLASQLADEYVAQNLPDASARFAYLIARLREGVARLLEFLQAEQRQSSFRPVAFEQTIGEGGEEPLRVVTPEGREVRVIGQIDRVDVMEREGKRYVRVVDYKTGDKEFRLDDVYCGLNTQMLFYLFTLCRAHEDAVPAGVLYLAGDPAPKAAAREDAGKPSAYRVDGLVLNDPVVIGGMDRAATGLFVPFTFTAKGAPRASAKLAGLEKLGNIEKHLESLVVEMARGLYAGDVAATPLCHGDKSPCAVCDYRAVCRHEDGCGERSVEAPDKVFEPKGGDDV